MRKIVAKMLNVHGWSESQLEEFRRLCNADPIVGKAFGEDRDYLPKLAVTRSARAAHQGILPNTN